MATANWPMPCAAHIDSTSTWHSCKQAVLQVHAAEPLLHYIQDSAGGHAQRAMVCTRPVPRAGIALLRAAKANALIQGRDYVAPDDVQAMFVQTMAHRLHAMASAGRGTAHKSRPCWHAVALPDAVASAHPQPFLVATACTTG